MVAAEPEAGGGKRGLRAEAERDPFWYTTQVVCAGYGMVHTYKEDAHPNPTPSQVATIDT